MNKRIYYIANNEAQFGPMIEGEAREWLQTHADGASCQIWDSETNRWHLAPDHPDFAAVFAPVTPPKNFIPNQGTKIYIEDDDQYQEKRRFIRLPVSIKIKYQDKQSAREGWSMKEALSQELSTAGISFIGEEKVPSATSLIISITPELQPRQPLLLEGLVRHSHPAIFSGMFETGVEFQELDAETRTTLKILLRTLLF